MIKEMNCDYTYTQLEILHIGEKENSEPVLHSLNLYSAMF